VRLVRLACLVVLVAIVASYALREARLALHPSVVTPWGNADVFMPVPAAAPVSQTVPEEAMRMMRSSGDESDAEKRAVVRRYAVDPAMKVQTGPGTPTWVWNRITLVWQGPVERGQEMQLMLVPPVDESHPRLRAHRAGRASAGADGSRRAAAHAGGGRGAHARLLRPRCRARRARSSRRSRCSTSSARGSSSPSPCGSRCVGINRLALEASGDVLPDAARSRRGGRGGRRAAGQRERLDAGERARRRQAGRPASFARPRGQLWLQVGIGRHDVLLEGRLPPRETVAIPLPEVPGA
jgi:hypothetical protein